MIANKRIPVREETWKDLNDIKSTGQTYDMLLQELIESKKKERLKKDAERILKHGKFVKLEL
jgi:predicted CopG family antitoxin